MFTGLIGDLGVVGAIEREGDGARLRIRTRLADELKPGDSIAVNGVCLTATEVSEGGFAAEAMLETLARSSLGALREDAAVNLELPLRVDDRLGGHVVQGHVDGTGNVREVRSEGFARVLEIDTEERLARLMVEKGSVAVDGVSLTVGAVREDGFQIRLIPETLNRTNLGSVGVGDLVNIEVDVLAKHVARLVGAADASSEVAT
ncbi:MAG: riboflavin synthase [Actinobacteria bacterium]|nr:MAG: riboflavin synthase [Actinomycetota bacterium]